MTTYSHALPPMEDLKDGDTIERVNLAQQYPGTPMLSDVTAKVTLRYCNVVNCIFPSNITVDKETCLVGTYTPQPEEPPIMQDVSDKAVVALAALTGSGVLSQEQINILRSLTDKVQDDAGTRADLGEALTKEVQVIIDSLRSAGKEETAIQVSQMLAQVQSVWRGE